MSQIEESGILSKVVTCGCGCKFKLEKKDIKAIKRGRTSSFFLAIISPFTNQAKSYIECPECNTNLYLQVNWQ